MNFVKTKTFCLDNLNVSEISVETDISRGLYNFSIIGMGDKAIDESRGRIQSAIKNSGFKNLKSVNQKITVLLAPASIKKEGSSFDLAIAISYLKASKYIQTELDNYVFIGELSLNGDVRPPKNFLYLFSEILKHKNKFIIVTSSECRKLCKYFIEDRIIYCDNLKEASEVEMRENQIKNNQQHSTNQYEIELRALSKITRLGQNKEKNFDYIIGCESAKRAIMITVTGRHNLLMIGPPGTGKTLLAKCIEEISPPLTRSESLNSTALHQLNNNLITQKPIFYPSFREPHHTSSYSAIVGDSQLSAGEITKAHNGFLFLDELPEFESRVIDALREPLESGKLTLSKRKGSVTLPACFTLIATMNPCKCGFRGSSYKKCICRNSDAVRYSQKISGPILDRFDMVISVDIDNRLKREVKDSTNLSREKVYEKIKKALDISKRRFSNIFPFKDYVYNGKLNISDYADKHDQVFNLDSSAKIIIKEVSAKLNLSKRTEVKIIKTSRTIADLEGSTVIKPDHIYEALSYRQQINKTY